MNNYLTPNTLTFAHRFLTRFGAAEQAGGDMISGANLLAPLLETICNLYPADSGIQDNSGRHHSVGCSFAVIGHNSSALVRERIWEDLALRQGNLMRNHESWLEGQKRDSAKPTRNRNVDGANFSAADGPHSIEKFLKLELGIQNPVALVLGCSADACRAELQTRPVVVVQATTPSQLEKTLPITHQSRPLVLIRLTDGAAGERFAEMCKGLLHGLSLSESPGKIFTGRIMADIAPAVLGDVVAAGGSRASWLLQVPWLVDDTLGPAPVFPEDTQPPPRLDHVVTRLEKALAVAWEQRLGLQDPSITIELMDIGPWLKNWSQFLAKLETDSPGITVAMRPLFITLLFGAIKVFRAIPVADRVSDFQEMVRRSDLLDGIGGGMGIRHQRLPAGLELSEVMAFARFLAVRTAQARQTIIGRVLDQRLHRIALRIAYKLSEGSLTQRDIQRKTHKLRASECVEALELLLSVGAADCVGGCWKLVAPVPDVSELITKARAQTVDV